MAKYGLKRPEYRPKWPNMALKGLKIGLDGPKIVHKWPEMAKYDLKRPQYRPKWKIMA